MGDLWDTYLQELTRRDLARSTRERYAQILRTYHLWLGDRPLCRELALDFLAELNQRGCSRSTYEPYVHVVWDFHRHAGQVLGLKLKRHKTLAALHPLVTRGTFAGPG